MVTETPRVEAEKDFMRWKHAVGLPQEFPKMHALDTRDFTDLERGRFYYDPFGLDGFQALTLDERHPKIALLIPRGQGATTTRDYMLAQKNRRVFSIGLSVDDVATGDATFTETLAERVRLSLATQAFVDIGQITDAYQTTLGRANRRHYQKARDRLQLRYDWSSEARKDVPTTPLTLEELVGITKEFYGKDGRDRSVLLHIDLSSPLAYEENPQAYKDALSRTTATLAQLHDIAKDEGFIREAYYGSSTALDLIEDADHKLIVPQINYHPINPLTMQMILEKQYPGKLDDRGVIRRVPLWLAIDQGLLTQHISPNKGINETMRLFEETLIEKCVGVVAPRWK